MKITLLGDVPPKGTKFVEQVPQGKPYKEPPRPTPAQRAVENASHSKVRATENWVDGHISSAKHAQIHARANKVIKSKGGLCKS
jgi:hypothetical protein